MARAQDGDAAAYEAALHGIAAVVRAYARVRLGNTIADDVVQEALITVHRARHTYDPARPLGPWLIAIAHSRVVDAARRLKRRERREETLPEEAAEPTIAGGDRTEDLERALALLPPRQRRIIEMLKFEGRSARDVAEALGLSVSNVKVIAHRGYESLRRTLRN
jgi:RNA polymerase sigma-70 factor, ECF subfamily